MSNIFESRIKTEIFVDLQRKILNKTISNIDELVEYCDKFRVEKDKVKILTDLLNKLNK